MYNTIQSTLCGIVLCLALLVAPANCAYAQQTHIQHYKRYNEALETGNFTEAEQAGEAAWRAAELELGNAQTTAILAYNFASIVYYTSPARAVDPLERVIAITADSADMFGAETPALMLAYARAASNNGDKKLKQALREQLEAANGANAEKTALSARGWYHITAFELIQGRFPAAEKAAANSLDHYASFRSEFPVEVANVLITRGISRVAGRSRRNDDIIAANSDFGEAVSLFPPQKNIETFNPLLAVAVAWDAVSHAVAYPEGPARSEDEDASINSLNLKPLDGVKWTTAHPTDEECQFVWESRASPIFPQADENHGVLGGVLVGYHFDDKSVLGARILAEVPQQSQFGQVALAAVEKWTLAAAPQETCRQNQLARFLFVLPPE